VELAYLLDGGITRIAEHAVALRLDLAYQLALSEETVPLAGEPSAQLIGSGEPIPQQGALQGSQEAGVEAIGLDALGHAFDLEAGGVDQVIRVADRFQEPVQPEPVPARLVAADHFRLSTEAEAGTGRLDLPLDRAEVAGAQRALARGLRRPSAGPRRGSCRDTRRRIRRSPWSSSRPSNHLIGERSLS
jgi:hypothetical protein